MARKFDDIQVGDQLELTAARHAMIHGREEESLNPDRVARVAIVTHIWHDPVEDKEYVGLAYIRRDGSCGKPTEKRTITGLARTGWRKAQLDWVARLRGMGEATNVVGLWCRSQKQT